MKHLCLILIVLLSCISCDRQNATSSQANPDFIKLGWKELKGLDYKNGLMDDIISSANGQKVKIAGFVTPLTDDAADIFEFTLVPYPVSCIHTPPPPPNQIVLVHLKNSHLAPEDLWSPFWVYGILKVDQTQNAYFTASYRLEADHIEKYN